MSDIISRQELYEAITEGFGGAPKRQRFGERENKVPKRVTGPAAPVDLPETLPPRPPMEPYQPDTSRLDPNAGMTNIQFELVADPSNRDVHVMDLQDWLNRLGMKVETDGYFTTETLNALNTVTGMRIQPGETIGPDILNQVADMAANG